jgi:hypothetical protein
MEHSYGLSNPQCEELVGDQMNWRHFADLGLQNKVPDETPRVLFPPTPARTIAAIGQPSTRTKRLHPANLHVGRRDTLAGGATPLAKEDKSGGDDDAGYTVKQG